MLPTQRFSSRVQDYVRYRPSYPAEIIPHLMKSGILRSSSIVADIGSGTGLLTELFLKNGNPVKGIEPNAEMRAAGEEQLRGYPRFTSIAATAEESTLADASVDLIVAGQAFHWFDRLQARREFGRILRQGSPAPDNVALIWNERLTNSPFLVGYEELLKEYSTDYSSVDHRQITDELLADFFRPHPVGRAAFANEQHFDFTGLRGRLLSSSYAPPAGHPDHEPMLAALAELFAVHQSHNQVTFEYQTQVFSSRLP